MVYELYFNKTFKKYKDEPLHKQFPLQRKRNP